MPDNAEITSAVLKLYGLEKATSDLGSSWTLQLQSGMPTLPQDPPQSSDYYYEYYSGNGGSLSSSAINTGYKSIQLNPTGLSWINKTGTTKFVLREKEHDASDNMPNYTTAGGENLWRFAGSTRGSGYQPILEVTYTTPTASTEAESTHALKDIEYRLASLIGSFSEPIEILKSLVKE